MYEWNLKIGGARAAFERVKGDKPTLYNARPAFSRIGFITEYILMKDKDLTKEYLS